MFDFQLSLAPVVRCIRWLGPFWRCPFVHPRLSDPRLANNVCPRQTSKRTGNNYWLLNFRVISDEKAHIRATAASQVTPLAESRINQATSTSNRGRECQIDDIILSIRSPRCEQIQVHARLNPISSCYPPPKKDKLPLRFSREEPAPACCHPFGSTPAGARRSRRFNVRPPPARRLAQRRRPSSCPGRVARTPSG